MVHFKTFGYNKHISATIDHPFYIDGNFIEAKDIDNELCLVNLTELNNNYQIDLKTICSNYSYKTFDNIDYIHPRWSSQKYSDDIVRGVMTSKLSKKDACNLLGVAHRNIYNWEKASKRKYKSCIS